MPTIEFAGQPDALEDERSRPACDDAGLQGLECRAMLGGDKVEQRPAAHLVDPPVARSVSYATAALAPARLYGLSPAIDGTMRITNGDPQFVFDTHLCATAYGFLQLEVEGTGAERDVAGSVFFSVDGQPATEAERIDFEWRADGRKHIVKVALLKHPRWKGMITTVRIDPTNAGIERNMATVLRFGHVQARGSF